MLIICPECGRQVSDKAEVCPHCGIKIAGNIYRNPSIQQPAYTQQQQNSQQQTYGQQSQFNGIQSVGQQPRDNIRQATPLNSSNHGDSNIDGHPGETQQKKSNKVYWISLVIAICIIAAGYYFYTGAQEQKEQDAYEYAMQSNDPMVLQEYLSKYMDAPLEHRDSVTAHLTMLQNEDEAWINAVNSGSRGALKQYIEQNPNSPHIGEAKNMIDSIDYTMANRAYNTNKDVTKLQQYLHDHPDGRYADEAQQLLDQVKDTEVTQEETAMAKGTCRKFFQAINSKNADKLVSTVTDVLSSFLNRTGATSDDVVSFMNKLYKDDITNMNWHIGNDFKATKVDDGMGGKNIHVEFSAVQNIERTDPTKEKVGNYIINAEVTQDGHIAKFNMKKKVAQ